MLHLTLTGLVVWYFLKSLQLFITDYEPDLAKEPAINLEDPKFDDFQKISDANRITIGLGMPTKTISGIRISMLIFQPGKTRKTYSKQQLHAEEFPYFVNGEQQIILTIAGNASKLGAEIYVASVEKSQNGIEKRWYITHNCKTILNDGFAV